MSRRPLLIKGLFVAALVAVIYLFAAAAHGVFLMNPDVRLFQFGTAVLLIYTIALFLMLLEMREFDT